MATVIDRVELTEGLWRHRHSALRLAVKASRDCLHHAECPAYDVDLLVNAGIYRDRNLGEPALAAMIQQDIGANPEAPHAGAHGTFSFDVVNGSCGVLTALQVVDGFLRSHAIDRALVVASDADPGHGLSERFPFAPAGGALLCSWTGDNRGFGRIHWANLPQARETFNATVGMIDRRNVLRFDVSETADEALADAAARAAEHCLSASSMTVDDVDAIVAAPAHAPYRTALAARLNVEPERITVSGDTRLHTVSLVAALSDALRVVRPGAQLLLVAAGAGVSAGASLYQV
ncbi:3-oxoacyl-ACP synthase [Mycolicibacterium acapulense]|uniref:3-oxoacyl-ACP synthase n=1 Tax=Mycobacterium lehmannii TaxID=2048550 RepID=A0A101A0U6_9MYCO|nr:3-oxoacyl-[acyl-carrier-protein] synthase III C-terminal domain-containing protein [Mycobacterium lehmannii]KUI09175.1 3-oxoacyl-ACP synthase [Mycobacterium lehmannii]KUI10488.1 3-oxoacyl-ACP synthase [Mycolicibacterium acapulense]KUI12651.1 3-oxoacyl-ACP synthase [Mycolicibacterium acapulense]